MNTTSRSFSNKRTSTDEVTAKLTRVVRLILETLKARVTVSCEYLEIDGPTKVRLTVKLPKARRAQGLELLKTHRVIRQAWQAVYPVNQPMQMDPAQVSLKENGEIVFEIVLLSLQVQVA